MGGIRILRETGLAWVGHVFLAAGVFVFLLLWGYPASWWGVTLCLLCGAVGALVLTTGYRGRVWVKDGLLCWAARSQGQLREGRVRAGRIKSVHVFSSPGSAHADDTSFVALVLTNGRFVALPRGLGLAQKRQDDLQDIMIALHQHNQLTTLHHKQEWVDASAWEAAADGFMIVQPSLFQSGLALWYNLTGNTCRT